MHHVRALLVAALLLGAGLPARARPALEAIVQESYAVGDHVRLSVRNAEGTVHIYASDEPGVRLTAIKKAFTQARLDAIQVQVQRSGDVVTIDTVFPAKPVGLTTADRSGTVDYFLLVPATATLTGLEVEDGEIIVNGLRGELVKVRLGNGKLSVENCFAPTELEIGRGVADLFYGWGDPRRFAVSAAVKNGDLNVSLPHGAAVVLDLATTRGAILGNIPGLEGAGAVRLTTGSGAGASFRLRAEEGSIRIWEMP